MDDMKKIAADLQEVIECPVCFGTMDSALKLCINGHGVCRACASKIHKCPTCHGGFVVIHQNTLLGKVLDRLPRPCPYTNKGCDTVVSDSEHQTYCKYRPTACKKEQCEWEGRVIDLLDHVRKCDLGNKACEVSLNGLVYRVISFDKNDNMSSIIPVILQGEVFWKYCHRNGLTKLISHKLYYMPTSKNPCDYFMIISFKKGNIEFKNACKALSENDESGEENGITIPDSMLNYFRRPGDDTMYDYTFMLVKENMS